MTLNYELGRSDRGLCGSAPMKDPLYPSDGTIISQQFGSPLSDRAEMIVASADIAPFRCSRALLA